MKDQAREGDQGGGWWMVDGGWWVVDGGCHPPGWWVPSTWHHTIPLGGEWRDGGRMKVDVGDDGCDEFLRKEATKAKAGICDKM